MRYILKDLVTICQEHILTEKILIMESHTSGIQLIENGTKEGNQFINLRTKTLADLTIEQCKNQLYKEELELIGDDVIGIYIDTIIRDLLAKKELNYFHQLKANPGFLKRIKNILIELRMSELNSRNIKDEQFINSEKAEDIRKILNAFENILEQNNQIDLPILYQLAMTKEWTKQNRKEEQIYIIPVNAKNNKLEKKYLEYISKGNIKVIGNGCINNIKTPAIFDMYDYSCGLMSLDADDSPLAYLYDLDKIKDEVLGDDVQIELVNAYGVINEAKAVLRNIKKIQSKLDDNLVLLAIEEPYTQLLHQISEKSEIPITFSEGIGIRNSKSGKLIFSLVDWLKTNYGVNIFSSIIRSGYLSTKDEKPSYMKIREILEKAKIGWDRNRYNQCFERLEQEFIKESEKYNKDEDLKTLGWIKNIIEKLFIQIPIPDIEGVYDITELAKGFGQIIKEFSKTNSEFEAGAKEAILSKLGILSKYQGVKINLSEALLVISDAIEGIRVGASSPAPGKIHVASYRKGLWLSRPNTFILGLDSSKFPGQAIEDPILLDLERTKLDQTLPIIKEKVKVNEYELLLLLRELKGHITLSYSSYNTIEHKEQNPANIVLQVYRMLEKDSSKDYKDLKNHFKNIEGYIANDDLKILSESEWWLKKSVNDKVHLPSSLFKEIYTGIARGIEAIEKQNSKDFTEYDGKVNFDISKYKRQINGIPKFSASQLEKIAKCPYSYFLSYVLDIKKPEEFEYELEVWLDSVSRGSLLHKIYERLYIELKTLGEKPSSLKHKGIMELIAQEEIENWKKILPPPSDRVYNYEKDNLMKDCQYFITIEEKRNDGFSPEYFEKSFGNEAFKELALKLKSGKSINVGGYIDRVDKRNNNEYRILDYKTGGTFGYGHADYFNQGKHIQHALYAVALEQELQESGVSDNPKVVEAGYLFPTEKGQGQWIGRDVSKRDSLYELLDSMLEIFEEGSYIRSDNKDKKESPCTFCDYLILCQNYSNEMIVGKCGNIEDKGIAATRRLKDYE